MPVILNVDVAHDCPLGVFLSETEKYGRAMLIDYTAVGPGGGNPNVTLMWSGPDAMTSAKAFARETQGDDAVGRLLEV